MAPTPASMAKTTMVFFLFISAWPFAPGARSASRRRTPAELTQHRWRRRKRGLVSRLDQDPASGTDDALGTGCLACFGQGLRLLQFDLGQPQLHPLGVAVQRLLCLRGLQVAFGLGDLGLCGTLRRRYLGCSVLVGDLLGVAGGLDVRVAVVDVLDRHLDR